MAAVRCTELATRIQEQRKTREGREVVLGTITTMADDTWPASDQLSVNMEPSLLVETPSDVFTVASEA